jgi:hypothetical protein
MLVSAILGLAVIGEAAYIARTRRQMDALYDQVQQLAAEAGADPDPAERPPSRPFARSETAIAVRPRLPPPRLAPAPITAPAAAPGSLPLPPALDSPEARDQLRQFVAAELQRERDDQRERNRQRFEEDQQRRIEGMVKTLGLNPDEGRRLTEALTAAQTSRRELRDKIQSGEMNRADIGREVASLREKTDEQVRQVLGDDRMQKFQELQRQQPGWGGGRGPGGGGRGPRGAPPPAQGGP